jgi:hypothetical protein
VRGPVEAAALAAIRDVFNLDNKQQSQAQSDRCKMQMAFRSARWRWEFWGTAWSNKSDANPPEGDTNPPKGETHEVCCLASQFPDFLISQK